MKGLVFILGKIWMFLVSNKALFSKFAPGIFVVSTFVFNLSSEGFPYALKELATSVFSAEKVINQNVTLAISNSPEYGFLQFFEIIISFMIIYNLIKLFTKALQKGPGGQSEWGCFVFAVGIVILIEYCAIAIIDRDFTFIPIYHGVFYLLMNLGPVFQNIHLFGFSLSNAPTPEVNNVVINNTLDTINTNFTK